MTKAGGHTVHIIETINAPVEKIWEIMRDFNGLPFYHPAVKASRIEQGDSTSAGCIRHLTLESGYVREQLLTLDEKNYFFEYSIIEGTLPVKNYKASVHLRFNEEKNQTTCEWWADFAAVNAADLDSLINLIGQKVFKAGFESISALLQNSENFCPA